MDNVRAIIAAGIRQYCNDLNCELSYHEPTTDTTLLQRFHDDAESIARYIISDGFKNARIVGLITDDPSKRQPRRYTDEDHMVWADES